MGRKLKSCDVPLTVMHHLPMDYPDLPLDWDWAAIAKLQASVLKAVLHDVLDRRVVHQEELWRWIISRRETCFSFPLCAEAFERVCKTDTIYQRYCVRLLAGAVRALHECKASRRMAACIRRWARSEAVYPFSFRACCEAFAKDRDVVRAQVEKLALDLVRKSGAVKAA